MAYRKRRFQVDMPLRDQLAALALEVKIELALITYFNESIPDPGENWDGRRKYREIDTRLKRLRWVNRELKKEYGGLKGAWNWLLGRGLPTGKELYSTMVDEADGHDHGDGGGTGGRHLAGGHEVLRAGR